MKKHTKKVEGWEMEIERIAIACDHDETDDIVWLIKDYIRNKLIPFYTQKLIEEFREMIGQNYRDDLDPKKDWEKGKYGEAVKYYGEGYNDALSEIKSRLEEVFHNNEKV